MSHGNPDVGPEFLPRLEADITNMLDGLATGVPEGSDSSASRGLSPPRAPARVLPSLAISRYN